MRRGRILLLLVLIVFVGLALVYFAIGPQILGGGGGPSVIATETVTRQVYYAAQNIPQGTEITREMLSTFSLPPENVAEVMFEVGEEQNLVGQTARFSLEQGTLITSSMVGAGPGDLPPPRWSLQVPAGMVAVSIPADRLSTAAYSITTGAHINVNVCMTLVDVDPAYQTILPNYLSSMSDIFFPADARATITIDPLTQEQPARQGRTELDPTFQKPIYVVPSEPQRPRLVCQIVLQDVVVLNLGNFELDQPQPVTTQTQQDPNAPAVTTQTNQKPDIITLMVSPQDSIALNYFVYSGAVFSMALRNPNDNSRVDAQSATLTSILTQYNISLPSKLPYAQNNRIDLLAPPVLPNDLPQQ
jgi:pilus assembly protein CpaB